MGVARCLGADPDRHGLRITAASALDFEEAYSRATTVEIEGITARLPSIADLIRKKRATGRTKDIADAEALEELADSGKGAADGYPAGAP